MKTLFLACLVLFVFQIKEATANKSDKITKVNIDKKLTDKNDPVNGKESKPQAKTSGPDAVYREKPIFVHFWGNTGEGIPNSPQGAHREERYMLSQPQYRDSAPFYAYDHEPQQIEVDDWRYVNGRGVRGGKKTVNVTLDYFLDDNVMDQMIEYTVRAGIQGFAFLFYADDAILKVAREAFVRNPNKRGLKMCYSLGGSMGSGRNLYPNASEYTNSINKIASHITQPYYQTIDGKPVLSVLAADSQLKDPNWVNENLQDISRIKREAGIEELYLIVSCYDYDSNDWVQKNGFDALTAYYHFGNYTNNHFGEVRTITNNWNVSNTQAGRNVAPLITCGLDSRAREWFYSGGLEYISRYYTWQSTYETLPGIIDDTINFLANNDGARISFINHADECTEQGLSFFPRKLANGTIDDTIIRIFQSKLNPNYNP
jgi:hypothetical protein